ncbi:MAG: AAA family ATPase [Sphingomonas sp.]|jgi:MoxR-like ATPase|uniref:ATP-binding protein n=1 Tax=Sphingomonas sp. TaxID=28214 RepID=UPI00356A13EF
MVILAPSLVAEALSEWLGAGLQRSNDFAREGLPACDVARLLDHFVERTPLADARFSIALVGFGVTQEQLEALAAERGISSITDDLHVATEWRNERADHPRIVALARGYNPSVHGLSFFGRSSSSELASHLLRWAGRQTSFTGTPMHVRLLAELAENRTLQGLRSLDGVARFLESWSSSPDDADAPRAALPELGLLPDPGLFEAPDIGRRLARNLAIRGLVTVLAPGEIRQRRQRAAKYVSVERRNEMEEALGRLERFRAGDRDAGLTLEDAERVVRPPKDLAQVDPTDEVSVEVDEGLESDLGIGAAQRLREGEFDALVAGREEDLAAIGEAIDRGWKEFDNNGDRVVATAETSQGPIPVDVTIDARAIDWMQAFCSEDRFGGLIETDVLDLKQALERYAECDPIFLETENIWRHDGRDFSLERLLDGWDAAVGPEAGRSLAVVWRELRESRILLAAHTRELLVHPREFLDTHPDVRSVCARYLTLSSELYGGVQSRFQVVSDESPEWAQATLDALLSLDLLQVRIRQDVDRVAAKAVMLPLHPLHLWRYFRMGEMLRAFAGDRELPVQDRKALIEELQRPEQFLSVVRAGRAPANRGLDQILPVANHVHGLATFENLRNAISSADGVDTLVRALDNYLLLYPNHARPLRLALVNPPEPTRLIERVVKLLEDRRADAGAAGRIEIDVFATDAFGDRLAAAAVLEGGAQDLIYEKVAGESLEIRVSPATSGKLPQLIEEGFGNRRYHLLGLFDESSIAIRKQRIHGFLRMSPFCIRNEITVDSLLGEIALRPHPGEPPFSDFVLMIQARQGERLDTAMYAAADADELRVLTDRLVTGPDPLARWVMLADRALPREAGMSSVRLLEREEGKRHVLLAAGDYDRLADVMEVAFQHCNLPVGRRELAEVLRQGAHLVGGGLLDLIRKQSGEADNANVVGFVGMLLAARDERRRHPDCLVASVDSRVARLWLRLGVGGPSNRCDLLALRRTEDGTFVFTALEVKTTLDPDPADEIQRIDAALTQVASTASVIRRALMDEDDDVFSAPRLEMLKEVLVRATGVRWSSEEADADHRRRWGPWLKELFDSELRPPVRVEGGVVLVKLRANRPARRDALQCEDLVATLSVVTEPLARSLLGIEERGSVPDIGISDATPTDRASPTDGNGTPDAVADAETRSPEDATWSEEVVSASAERDDEVVPTPVSPAVQSRRETGTVTARSDEAQPPASAESDAPAWPPPLNALGMIGQVETARELADLARKSKGWNERFPDKLLVGPAGVGKTSIAYEVAKKLLGLEPILFNGADLRRPEMIVQRLEKAELVPDQDPDVDGPVLVAPCVIFVDEVHAIPPTVATALLSALDERRTTTVDNVVYDFSRVVFLLATTDPGKLTEAFLSRPTRTTLRAYTLEETAGIVWLRGRGMLDGADLPREACIEIAARMQCGPRPSVQILNPLIAYFYSLAEAEAGGEIPTRQSVASRMTAVDVGGWFSNTLQVDANGLGPVHRDFLKILASRGAVSEDEIRRSLAISNKGDFVEIAEYLTRLGLIRVGPGGRSLTGDGRRYVLEGDRMDLRARIPRRGAG